jgi:predicted AlkP superfamily phosphohydrolase/phosphomutase/Tfp pilus assembly protein PilF
MEEKYSKRIISLLVIVFLSFFTLFCSKESQKSKEEFAEQVSPEEVYPGEESLRLKRDISQKIVKTNTKILLIGLDAADWLIIDPLIEQGKLPHLAKLKREGAWGNLRSFPPILSPIVWTSIGTGKPPEEHGIADFLTVDTRTGKKVPISRISRKVKTVWNIFSDFGLSCDIIGWWATWPAERIKGHMVTERISYNLFNLTEDDFVEQGKTHPPQLFKEIKPLVVSAEKISYEEIKDFIHISKDEYSKAWKEVESGHKFDNRVNHLRKILASTKTFHSITLKLLQKGQADFLSVYFEGIDTVSHRFILYMPPKLKRASSEDYRKYKDAIENFYVFQDQLVGELLASVGSETTVIVISDHGFYSGGGRPMTQPDDFTTGAQVWHRPVGIVILFGKWIKPGRVDGANIFDIAPTLLYLSGLPIPEDMSGKPLVSAVSSDFKNSFQIAQIDTYEKVNPIRYEEVPRDSRIDKERIAELKSLGYIGGGSEESESQEVYQKSASQKDFRDTLTTHYNLGRNYLYKKQYAKAEEEFKKGLSVDPNFQFALYFLAKTCQEQNRIEEAIQCLKRIISTSSDVFSQTYILLTNLYIEKGEPESAEKILQSALVIKKEVSEIHSGLGFIYEKSGEMEKAEKEYLKALELNPLDFSAISRIFSLYIIQNRPQEAEKVIQKVASLPDIPNNALYDWGVMCLQHKRFNLAEKIFKDLLQKTPKNPGVMVNLGFCYASQGRIEEAKSIIEEATKEMPDNPKVLYNLGTLYVNTGEPEQALRYYKRALKAGEPTPQICNALGKVYFRLGDKHSSLEMLRKSLGLNPNQPDIIEMVQILENEIEGKGKS